MARQQEMGVPQSSILSVALFALKINSIVKTLSQGVERAFSVAGPTVFNSLHTKIRLSHSIVIFKRHLDSYIYNALVCPPPSAFETIRRYANVVALALAENGASLK